MQLSSFNVGSDCACKLPKMHSSGVRGGLTGTAGIYTGGCQFF